MQTKEKKKMRQRHWSKRRNCQQKCFHSFSYVIDHTSIHFFFYVNSLHCFVWFLLLLAASFELRLLHSSHNLNFENVLQRNLRTDRFRECILEYLEAEFWKFLCQTWWCLHELDVHTSLPKKLWISHWVQLSEGCKVQWGFTFDHYKSPEILHTH